MIIVKPQAGLCNRMRVINSCLVLQKRNPSAGTIKLLWETNQMLNCEFNDLFESIERIHLIKSNYFLNYFSFFNYQNSLSSTQRIKKRLLSPIIKRFSYYDNEIMLPLRFNQSYWDNNKTNFLIDTYSDFYEYTEGNYYNLFKPISELQKIITKQLKEFIKPPIGIHIRRTDNLNSISKSRDDLFVNYIYGRLKQEDNALFFLSSDDLSVEERFKKEFGSCLITRSDKDPNRNSKRGMQDALVDLYILAATKEIAGSYGSSFSRIASLIMNIPLTVIC